MIPRVPCHTTRQAGPYTGRFGELRSRGRAEENPVHRTRGIGKYDINEFSKFFGSTLADQFREASRPKVAQVGRARFHCSIRIARSRCRIHSSKFAKQVRCLRKPGVFLPNGR